MPIPPLSIFLFSCREKVDLDLMAKEEISRIVAFIDIGTR